MTSPMRDALDAINESLNASKVAWLAACKVEAAEQQKANADLLAAAIAVFNSPDVRQDYYSENHPDLLAQLGEAIVAAGGSVET